MTIQPRITVILLIVNFFGISIAEHRVKPDMWYGKISSRFPQFFGKPVIKTPSATSAMATPTTTILSSFQDEFRSQNEYTNLNELEPSMVSYERDGVHHTTYLPEYKTEINDDFSDYSAFYDHKTRGTEMTPHYYTQSTYYPPIVRVRPSPIFAQIVIGTERHYARCNLVNSVDGYFPQTATKYVYVTPSVAPPYV